MKNRIWISLLFVMMTGTTIVSNAANGNSPYGRTLNLGLGIGGYAGYYSYVGRSMPVFHLNYELDVARNFTLAPFLTFYSYRDDYYRETVIPVGLKGSFYFDEIVEANANWDFYLAGSLGFAIVNTRWDNDYHGDRGYYHTANPLFFDFHLGTEYHVNSKLGLFLDLSSGVSTIGISLH